MNQAKYKYEKRQTHCANKSLEGGSHIGGNKRLIFVRRNRYTQKSFLLNDLIRSRNKTTQRICGLQQQIAGGHRTVLMMKENVTTTVIREEKYDIVAFTRQYVMFLQNVV
ncbi:MAG: hypothetical protein JKY01_07060 [Pseudomonadales bacterium]|nr:hypothetical protein [Pseudomonadales bacterium]